eukprot:9755336-Karenia_brevis.AAC.1
MEVDAGSLKPVTAQASQEAQNHKHMYEMSVSTLGPDHSTTKTLKDVLDKHVQKAGSLAQCKNHKQIADA